MDERLTPAAALNRAATWVEDFDTLLTAFRDVDDAALLDLSGVIVGPLRVDYESREQMRVRGTDGRYAENHARIAVKSGPYTLFVIGDYYDGGYDALAACLEWLCRVANVALHDREKA